jgi:hypothetical protein
MYSLKERQLIERIEKNYTNFRSSLTGLSRQKLIESAGHIAAVTTVYERTTTENFWSGDEEIDFFLLFSDPLMMIADECENFQQENSLDFLDRLEIWIRRID